MSVEIVSHLAGEPVFYTAEEGEIMRQRCCWCGALLEDWKSWLMSVAVEDGQEPDLTPPHWTPGRFVDWVHPDGAGGWGALNTWEPGAGPVPETACMRMNPDLTA